MKNTSLYVDRSVVSTKIKEAFSSVLPIALIVFVLSVIIVPIESGLFIAFIFGTFLAVFGTGIFTLGADVAMTPIGEYVSKTVVKSKKIWIILPVYFIVGVLITVSEPDLQVLATQIGDTLPSKWLLIITVGVGVGVFLVIAFLRMVLKIKMAYVLIACYTAVIVLSFFVPSTFVPLSFDSGGVTTGPMSVPFLIAIGTGIASVRTDKKGNEDGFGLTALCSIGPIISVMILGIIFNPQSVETSMTEAFDLSNSREVFKLFLTSIPKYLKEVGIALLPITLCFFVSTFFGGKIEKNEIVKIIIGIIYTYVGLVIFLLGVNCGFLNIGNALGKGIGELSYNWIAVPVGMIIGYFVVSCEPAVHVLTKQVYEVTNGTIPQKALRVSLMIGISVSVGLAMLRILLRVNVLYFVIPGYAIALILTLFVPDLFTAIAFDSGGVASGAMTASFVLPFTLGICEGVGGNIATDGFGVVALVAMTPLITIQLLGLIFRIRVSKVKKKQNDDTNKREKILD